MIIPELLLNIIQSDMFKEELIKINSNFSNLKQESVIKNTVLEIFNTSYANDNIKAIAEHPRINKTIVDLSIVNKQNLDLPFKIEFKFQFSKQDNSFYDYEKRIKKAFTDRKTDMFILIVKTFDKKLKDSYDKSWGITTNFSKKQSDNPNWNQNLMNCLKHFVEVNETKISEPIQIFIEKPYPTIYHFYTLYKII